MAEDKIKAQTADAADKMKALEAAMQKIEKTYGKGSIMNMASQTVEDIEVIHSGSLTLDIALGVGGYPRGRIVEIYGPESSGKTTLAIHAIAEAQKGWRSRRHHRCRTRLRPLLCGEARCRPFETLDLSARQRRAGT